MIPFLEIIDEPRFERSFVGFLCYPYPDSCTDPGSRISNPFPPVDTFITRAKIKPNEMFVNVSH